MSNRQPQLTAPGQLYGSGVLVTPEFEPTMETPATNTTGPRAAFSWKLTASEHDVAVNGQKIFRVVHRGVLKNELPLKDCAVQRAEIVPPEIVIVPVGWV